MKSFVEYARKETVPCSLREDSLRLLFPKPPIASNEECKLVPPTAELLRIIPLAEDNSYFIALIPQSIDQIDHIVLYAAAIAVLPVVGDEGNFHVINP